VLVVDDDRLQLRAIERVLRDRAEIELTVADNAIDAMIAVGALKPDLVLMDVLMPGLDGIEACRRIKSNPETRDIQIILASAMMTPELARAARHAGARRAVAKPLDMAELLGSALVADEPTPDEPAAIPTVRGADLLIEMLAAAGSTFAAYDVSRSIAKPKAKSATKAKPKAKPKARPKKSKSRK
jgi:CheY-like chemotaxis protein